MGSLGTCRGAFNAAVEGQKRLRNGSHRLVVPASEDDHQDDVLKQQGRIGDVYGAEDRLRR